VANEPTERIDPLGLACCNGVNYDDKVQCCKNNTLKDKFKVCIRSTDSHSWISVVNLHTGEQHTYGRWKLGYGGQKKSGVAVDIEKKNYENHSYEQRCTEVCDFSPTITPGFGNLHNN